VAIAEKINQRMGKIDIKSLVSQPRALARLAKGLIKSKLAGRKLMPKDLWTVKGIFSSGTDGTIFKNVIKDTWGRYPLNVYASTEGSAIATQTWDYDGMTFIPNMNFLEFIPEAEYEKWKENRSYIPGTVLLDEVKPNNKYELVITNFHGAPLTRYRTGDIIKITSLRNKKLSIELPQMEFEGRIDDVIDIGGFVRLTEKVIWQAISNTAIPYVDWAGRKEQKGDRSFLHVYLELKGDTSLEEDIIARAIYTELKKMDEEFLYGNVETVLNSMPVRVTLLPKGAFENHINLRRSQGADLAHLKPRHINPTDKELAILGLPVAASTEADRVSVGAPAAS
jgi:phenylacetate-coenzyme A ligase PaaK-like adenylate-forming protein